MAPVMSSVTVACCVRSPSATACQLVHEPKNGRLVGVVDALGFQFLRLRLDGAASSASLRTTLLLRRCRAAGSQ
jgi:hypothetical protein